MDTEQLSFEIHPGPTDAATSKIMVARIKVTPTTDVPRILSYFRSHAFKSDFVRGYLEKHESGCGIELRGGPRPVFKIANDRGSEVLAYEQDVRITKGI